MPWVRPAISVARCVSASPASARTWFLGTRALPSRGWCSDRSSPDPLNHRTRSIETRSPRPGARHDERFALLPDTDHGDGDAGDLLDPLQECPGLFRELIDGARVARLSPPRQVLIYWLHPHHGCGVWHRGKHTGPVSVRDADLHRLKSVEHVQFHYRKIGKTGDLGGEPRRDAIKPPAPARPASAGAVRS